MKTKDFSRTIELLKGKRELPQVFKEMQEVINGTPDGESPYISLLLNEYTVDRMSSKPFFKTVDFHFYNNYTKNFEGENVDCLSILIDSNLDAYHFVGNMKLEAELRLLMTKLQAKYNFASEVDWNDRSKTWIMCTHVWSSALYYLADLCLPQIKQILIDKYKNIAKVTDCASSFVVILKESMQCDIITNGKTRKQIDAEHMKMQPIVEKREALRKEIAQICYKIIKQNDELDFWKNERVHIDFGDKIDLDSYIEEYGDEGLSMMAQSNWEHGGCLY